jgi:hypothetical protein
MIQNYSTTRGSLAVQFFGARSVSFFFVLSACWQRMQLGRA